MVFRPGFNDIGFGEDPEIEEQIQEQIELAYLLILR